MRSLSKPYIAALILPLGFLIAGCHTDITEDPDGLQAITEKRLAREALPGKAHYEKHCAACHNGDLEKAPHKDMIGLMTSGAILMTISDGIMVNEASMLSDEARVEVAEYLSGAEIEDETVALNQCPDSIGFERGVSPADRNWGIQPTNTRKIDAVTAGISSENVGTLTRNWAVAFPGASRVRSQPLIAGGLVFVGSHNGMVYAFDSKTGCVAWQTRVAAEVRTGITLGNVQETSLLFFGDVLGNVYGADAATGKINWRLRADDHPNATITGSPSFHAGVVYAPVSALEVSLAINPQYECCTFRGSVVAIDAATGLQIWKTYTIQEEPTIFGQNPVGTDIIGPSGAVVWNSPSIDETTNQLFVGTGENMSSPASLTSDALIAMDLDSGKINWVFQATANDVWNGACDTKFPQNCPVENGPDFDFGGATIIVETSTHGSLVIAGQKSGFVHAIDPATGKLVWQTRVGRGGIQGGIHFGIAASGETLLVPISDMADGRSYPDPDNPGMNALDANTGKLIWSVLHENQCDDRPYCHPGISQVPTVIGDMVVAGSMDGLVRAYAVNSGEILWVLDTTDDFESTLGKMTRGGSLGGAAGPIASSGMLLISSGYGIYNHMPGNLLLSLSTNTPINR